MNANQLIKSLPWQVNCGIEQTFQAQTKVIKGQPYSRFYHRQHVEHIRIIKKLSADYYSGRFPAKEVATDPGCIEVPSPILTSWEDAKDYHDRLFAAAAKYKLKPQHPYAASGMGHIHMSEFGDLEEIFFFRDLAARPYLTWAFISASYSDNAQTFAASFIIEKVMLGPPASSHWHRHTPHIFHPAYTNVDVLCKGNEENLRYLVAELTCVYRSGYNTFEWRAFDAASTWDEQVDHLAFIQAYVRYVKRRARRNAAHLSNRPPFHDFITALQFLLTWTKEDAIREFKNFIIELGLPWSRYRRFTDNIATWFSDWGTPARIGDDIYAAPWHVKEILKLDPFEAPVRGCTAVETPLCLPIYTNAVQNYVASY